MAHGIFDNFDIELFSKISRNLFELMPWYLVYQLGDEI